MATQLWIFVLTTVTVLVLPGPDFVLVARTTVSRGRRHGFATAAGILVSLAGYTAIAAAGLTVVLATNTVIATVVRVAGIAYLLYLAASLITGAWKRRRSGLPSILETPRADQSSDGRPSLRRGLLTSFGQGFANNALNPKALVFFSSLLPQFVVDGSPVAPQVALLGVIVIAMSAVWWTVCIAAIGAIRAVFQARRVRTAIDLASGGALALFAALLAMPFRA